MGSDLVQQLSLILSITRRLQEKIENFCFRESILVFECSSRKVAQSFFHPRSGGSVVSCSRHIAAQQPEKTEGKGQKSGLIRLCFEIVPITKDERFFLFLAGQSRLKKSQEEGDKTGSQITSQTPQVLGILSVRREASKQG
jgi:hypothetical protein